jgi:hypothetical protein
LPLICFQNIEEDTAAISSTSKTETEQGNWCEFSKPPPMKKCKKRSDPAVDEACGLLRTVTPNLGKSDRFTVFGEYVANRV